MAGIDQKKTGKRHLGLEIETACEGMFYLSETDAGIFPFFGGPVEPVTLDALLKELEITDRQQVEEISFDGFFLRLTKINDWFGVAEKENANRFEALKKLLENNLDELTVFRIGQIRIDIYVLGIDKDGNLAGIRTAAVET